MNPEILTVLFDMGVVAIATLAMVFFLYKGNYLLSGILTFVWIVTSLLFAFRSGSASFMVLAMGALAVVLVLSLYLIRKTLPTGGDGS